MRVIPGSRCAAHPARPAVDLCPRCERPRCGADASVPGAPGCAACRQAVPPSTGSAGRLERYVRACLAAAFCAYLGGNVTKEYVGAPLLLAYVAPFMLGVLCGAAAFRAAGTDGRGLFGARVRLLAILYGLLGTALAVRLEHTHGGNPLSARHQVLLAYGASVLGTVLWTLPPKSRPPGAGPGRQP